ncbi:site-specific integrase [Nocardia vinacea]|uniref:site-specific integrase n=1 Tax=Nocardia vinacea TaxID=96468 RepID=UPI00343A9BF0
MAATVAPAAAPPQPRSTGQRLGREAMRTRFPPRPISTDWPRAGCGREEALRWATAEVFVIGNPIVQAKRVRGLRHLLDWLADQPGDTWQQRWLGSGTELLGPRWRQAPLTWLEARGRRSKWLPVELSSAMRVLIFADILRPTLRWLAITPSIKSELAAGLALERDPAGFSKLRDYCHADTGISDRATRFTAQRAAVIIAAKGGTLADITVGDVLELVDTETDLLTAWPRDIPVFYQILHDLGFLGDQAPQRFRQLRTGGQLTPDQLVDRYELTCRPIRNLLVDYLKERQPSLDYNSLKDLSYYLARRFWKDIELHHPGIDTLDLPPEVAAQWRQRVQEIPRPIRGDENASGSSGPGQRISFRECLVKVRAFYLDLSQWALEDPGRWAQWVAPNPVGRNAVEHRKAKRHRKARMDARTRERLPVLPVLVTTVERRKLAAAEMLATAENVEPEAGFTAAGQQLTRLRPFGRKLLVIDSDGCRRDLRREEEYAFWAWAAVNVLRLTGIRIEELMEITHHSLIQYRLPTTGEIVPLLQIAPSKTDAERLLVVSPELADVLSAVIVRIRDDTGVVPLIPAYDWHECLWRPPAPVLFQRRFGTENRAINHSTIRKMIYAALADTGLTDPATGGPLTYTPHDFRRLFITDAVLNGLPPHIAQVIAGHRDINVTMGYKAIYPEEAIQAHLSFLARRRSLRPTEEYRVPTDDEWTEFLGHFERRKVSTGLCARAYSTPCIHEHAPLTELTARLG